MAANPPYDSFPPSARGVADNRDLVIPPGSHAFVQTLNNGEVRVHVGPKPVTFSGQEQSIRFNGETDTFETCTRDQSLAKNIQAKQGQYIILENPAFQKDKPLDLQFPSTDLKSTPELAIGKRVIIQGPVDFALWPRQKATVVDGHQLRSNQYLEAVVYDPVAAKENWNKSLSVPSSNASGGTQVNRNEPPKNQQSQGKKSPFAVDPDNLIVGQRLVICGTDVSFYIPPTGVEVLQNNDSSDESDDSYVRNAVTLERLEYAILVDEDGNKRYEQGPKVVFPKPTEQFIRSSDRKRKFRAIELPQKAGIHIKVIADYEEGTVQHKTGEELFITGDQQSIYFPREEHSIITYGEGSKIHYGVAIPKGEGRYVMDRLTGEIRTETGPTILLCDPRSEVVVRRVLTDKQCQDWYPGNNEALAYNQGLRQMQEIAGTAGNRPDVLDEESFSRGISNSGYSSLRSFASSASMAESASTEMAGEAFHRRNKHTPPRAITLNTKYDGVPTIELWAGHAVQVVDRSGKREIIEGPKAILLDYDQTLEIMGLSTGKPKTTDRPLRTVYLRTQNNKVSDIIPVETRDHVICDIKLSFSVNFEKSKKDLWFSCENYIKLLCDHVRSILKGEVRKMTIEDFYLNATQVIRDNILGTKKVAQPDGSSTPRPGMMFEQNGMRVTDVEVLAVDIKDPAIAQLLGDSQRKVVHSNILMQERERDLKMVEQSESIEQGKLLAKSKTEEAQSNAEMRRLVSRLTIAIKKSQSELEEAESNRRVVEAKIANSKLTQESELAAEKAQKEQDLAIQKAAQDLKIQMLTEETKATVERFGATSESFLEGLMLLNREEMLAKVATACSWQTVIGGQPLGDVIKSIFGGDSPITKALATAMATKSSMSLPSGQSR